MRAVLVGSIAILAACGLGVTGEEPATLTPDAGRSSSGSPASSSSTSSGGSSSGTLDPDGGGPDSGPAGSNYCATLNDPKVRTCLDFDDDPKYDAANRGFSGIDAANAYKILPTLDPSPLGASAKRSVAFAFDAVPAGTKRDTTAFIDIAGFAQGVQHLSLDADIAIDTFDNTGVIIAGFRIVGDPCALYSGLKVELDGLYHHRANNVDEKVGTFQKGVPFHLRLDTYPVRSPGIAAPETLSINGGTPHSSITVYDASCNVAQALVGHYFADFDQKNTFKVRFDQIVLRVE